MHHASRVYFGVGRSAPTLPRSWPPCRPGSATSASARANCSRPSTLIRSAPSLTKRAHREGGLPRPRASRHCAFRHAIRLPSVQKRAHVIADRRLHWLGSGRRDFHPLQNNARDVVSGFGSGRRPDPRTSGLIRTGRIPGERSQPRPDPAPMRALSRCRTDVDLGHAVGVAGETHLFARQLCQPRTRNVQASVTRSFIGIVAKCTSQTRAVLSSDCAYQLRTLAPWQHLRARATTKLYDRTAGIIMLDEVERIVI
jgi:hypothetical protein